MTTSLRVDMNNKPERTMIATTVERSSRTLYKRRWNAFPKLGDDDAITIHHRSLTMTIGGKSTGVVPSSQPNAPMGSARFVALHPALTRNWRKQRGWHVRSAGTCLRCRLMRAATVAHAGAAVPRSRSVNKQEGSLSRPAAIVFQYCSINCPRGQFWSNQ